MSADAHARVRPRIGISACCFHPADRPVFKGKRLLYAEQSMVALVESAGGLGYLVPLAVPGSPVTMDDYVADLDGLLLSGGDDVCPRTYGEAPLQPRWEGDEIRDHHEIALVRAFLHAGKPVLGICRGAQLLNVAFGGTLYQDIPTQVATDTVHRDPVRYDRNVHAVELAEDSTLAGWFGGAPAVTVNSVHHQAIRDLGAGLVVEARSATDGIIEAVRLDAGAGESDRAEDDPADHQDPWAYAVQWHPEFWPSLDGLVVDGPPLADNRPILDAFLTRAAPRRDADREARR